VEVKRHFLPEGGIFGTMDTSTACGGNWLIVMFTRGHPWAIFMNI
jgi:hypothetical protein